MTNNDKNKIKIETSLKIRVIMNIKKILDSIMQQDESVFPMDSFPGSNEITDDEEDERKKKRQIIRTVYPESESEDMMVLFMIMLIKEQKK